MKKIIFYSDSFLILLYFLCFYDKIMMFLRITNYVATVNLYMYELLLNVLQHENGFQ